MTLQNKFNMSDWTSNTTTLLLLTKFRERLNMTTMAPPENDTFYPISLVLPFTFIYALIFVTGVVGNVSTCIVIARNRSMHTATNYYLFSLAISDMLLLISGLPPEMYRIWSPNTYIFGEAFCILQGFAAETSANATVLTITAFTIERYLAICHPFLSYTMSKLSRAIRLIFAIWTVALCLAVPQAIQFGLEHQVGSNGESLTLCTVVSDKFAHAFEISTFVFFVGPMTLITVLYILIGCQLRQSERTLGTRRTSSVNTTESTRRMLRHQVAQHKVVRMLIAVVTAFFVCWAPFHAQRLLAVYLTNASAQAQHTFMKIYTILMYMSGVLYFLSTTINPLLYSIMSNKFRKAFQKTFCRPKRNHTPSNCLPAYRYMVKEPPLMRTMDNVDMNPQQTSPNHLQIHKEPLKPKGNTTPHPNSADDNVQGDFLDGCQSATKKRPRCSSKVSQISVTTTTTTSRMNSFDSTHMQPTVPHTRERWRFFSLFDIFRNGTRGNRSNRMNCGRQNHGNITISNSSLQDLEETEITSYELVKYMREVNEKL